MDDPTQSLVGRRVLVTGASSGIGAATARAIVAAGGSVALLARRTSVLTGLAHELRDEVEHGNAERGPGAAGDQRIAVVPADVVDATACRAAVDRAADELGGLDGLVNAAGVLRPGSTLDGDPADWQLMLDVNVRGVLHVTTAAADHLRTAAAGTRPVDVVTVSSMSGRRLGTTQMAVYAASKAAVHMFSEGMRREFAADGIRLALVSPGVVATELFAGDDDTTAALARRADEAGLDPSDVGAAIVGLLAAPAHVVHQEVALRHLGQ